MPFLDEPAPDLSFGDFCESEFFFDAYLRADAASLRARTVSNDYVKKQFKRDSLTSYIAVDESVPELKSQQGFDFLLAHGTPFGTAACLSDDCEITGRLGRDGSDPSGRLVFAPITALKSDEEATLTETNWGRIRIDDAVVELRRSFAVAAEDIAALDEVGLVRRSLDEDSSLRLATWWSAYACRRGPLVDAVNLAKIRAIGEAQGEPELAGAVEDLVKPVLLLAWRLQGHAVELGGALYDDNHDDLTVVDWDALLGRLRNQLADLEEALEAARGALS